MYHIGHAWSHMVRSLKPAYWDEATLTLGRRDGVLRKLIRAHPHIHLQRRHDPFTTLARAIVGQQISVKAADSIWRRFVATVRPGTRSTAFPRLDPVIVAASDVASLRDCGLSGRKVEYLRDLAHAWRPYRSVATWYLWRSLDPIPVQY
jgi:DNA-3-methyladenine glycosylase II